MKSVIADGVLEGFKKRLDAIRLNKAISKIVIAGGSYVHEDFIEKVDSVFGIPSQMAYARNITGRSKDINNPAHLASIGLTLYGCRKRRERSPGKKPILGVLHKATRRMSAFLEEYF